MTRDFKVFQLDHVEIAVPSRREAAVWYAEILGLEIVPAREHWSEDPRGPLMISSDDGNTMIALFRGEPRGGRPVTGVYLAAFRVDGPGFCAFLDRLETHPVYGDQERRLSRGDVADHGQAFSVYFNDPYGNRLEITSYDERYLRERLT